MTAAVALGLAATVSATGCKGCTDRKPYTPFSLDGGSATRASAATSAAAAPSSSGFEPVTAVAAARGDQFPLEPGTVAAPPGRVFASGLAIDADGDEVLDLFAWVETPDHTKSELWFVKGSDRGGQGLTVATPPKDLGDSSCKRDTKLSQIGPRTVLARVDARCAEQKTHTWFAIVRLHGAGGVPRAEARDPETRLEGRLRPASAGETFGLAFGADDRDGDKIDDLRLDLTLEGVADPYEAGGKVMVPITFLERPAGFARDPAEPDATLTKMAAGLVQKARSTKGAGDVPSSVAQLLRVASVACDELGSPLLTTTAGSIRCGDDHFVSESIYAVGLAGITSGNVAQAIAASGALAEIKPSPDKRIKELDAAITKAAPIVEGAIVRRITAAPAKGGVLAPITFDADGNLLVVGESGVTRVSGSDFAEEKSEAVAWPRTIAWRSSSIEFALDGAARRCSPNTIVATGKVSGGPVDALLPTISGMIPSGVRGSCREAELPLAPLVTQGDGAVVAVGAEVIRIESSGSGLGAKRTGLPDAKSPPSLPGASRSPDGSASAVTLVGDAAQVLVVGPKGARRWHNDDLRDARVCVPRANGDRIACLTKSGVVLAEPR